MLSALLSERTAADELLRGEIGRKTADWGISVKSVEIRDVAIPVALQDAMSRQALAEREKQARLILGSAEAAIAGKFVKAGDDLSDHPTALQLRAMNIIYETTKEARRHDPDADIDGRNAMEKIMTRRLATKNILLIIAGVLILIGVASTGALYVYWDQAVPIVGMAINYYRSLSAPTGTTSTELASGSSGAGVVATSASAATATPNSARGDWPSYNKTLTSERYSQLSQINTKNVGKLKVLCTYDTGQYTSFETGPIMVNGALIGTTEHDIFSIDPANCHQNWRTHEDYKPANILAVNRGAAYLDGLLFRGTEDGRVLAYDFKTGKRVWETIIADPKLGETTPAAPIAWNGLVFIGNAGGDNKGVKGRMYALDAKTGKIVWEFYLVPKTPGDPTRGPQGTTPLDMATWKNASGTPMTGGATWTSYTLDPATGELYIPGGNPAPDFAIGPREGEDLYSDSIVVLDAKTGAYKNHFKLVPKDWHDWDASTAPALIRTKGGRDSYWPRPRTDIFTVSISPPTPCSTARRHESRTPMCLSPSARPSISARAR